MFYTLLFNFIFKQDLSVLRAKLVLLPVLLRYISRGKFVNKDYYACLCFLKFLDANGGRSLIVIAGYWGSACCST